jgi:serine/threonine protein kinase
MIRLTNDKENQKNNLFFTKGKIITLKSDEDKNNSDSEISKNKLSENNDKNINIKKYNKRKSKNLSVENIHTDRKNNYDSYSEKKINYKKKKFIKCESIGEGRFGHIYFCMKFSGVERYTVKIFNEINEKQKKKIIKNLDNIYKLNHKNILKAVYYDENDLIEEFGDLSILYESVNSRNVEDLMKEYGSFDEKLLKVYIKQILEGLKYLHENKIYHKNLKPTNFLVDEGTVKISDCLVDSLIIGNSKTFYNNLLKSAKINTYIPPFFIKEMNDHNDKKTNNSGSVSSSERIFNNWKSFDLWCLGCSIIEVASKKKPWSHYNFKDNLDFIKFIGSTNLVPTIPQKLSAQCQELIQVLFNYSLTKEKDIYEKLFNLDFFKEKIPNNNNNKINNISESQTNGHHSEDSNSISSGSQNNESGMQLGQYLAKNKVVNLLNSNDNASFSVSYTVEESNSLAQSYSKLNQSNTSNRRNMNIKINNKINNNNMMEKVDETMAQNEYSPDYVKIKKENNFEL